VTTDPTILERPTLFFPSANPSFPSSSAFPSSSLHFLLPASLTPFPVHNLFLYPSVPLFLYFLCLYTPEIQLEGLESAVTDPAGAIGNSLQSDYFPIVSPKLLNILGFLFQFLAHVNSRSRSLYAIARPSVVCRLSVCLSVCNVRAPYSGGSNFRQYFYGIRYLGHPLTFTENFTEIVPEEPLRRGS